MGKARILIAEDKFVVAQDLSVCLRKLGYAVLGICSTGDDTLAKARELRPDLLLLDIRLKGKMDGIEVAETLCRDMEVPVVFLTAHSDEDTLHRASLTNPGGYVVKPFEERQLYTTIELALNRPRMERAASLEPRSGAEAMTTDAPVTEDDETRARLLPEFRAIIGTHPSLVRLLHNVSLVAATDVTVHIFGENGTGKELIADALHALSARRSGPFVKLNCSAIPTTLLESALFGHSRGAFTGATRDQEGFLERAKGGTLFLDEIGDVSAEIQVKLLRVLQSREYTRVGETEPRHADVRIVTATNRDLRELMREGKIREDFYYRVHVFPLEVPPLRERGDDVLLLAEHFRVLFNRMFSREVIGFTAAVKRALVGHAWPGNVRELENVLRRAFVLVKSGEIDVSHLPKEFSEYN